MLHANKRGIKSLAILDGRRNDDVGLSKMILLLIFYPRVRAIIFLHFNLLWLVYFPHFEAAI